jgi:hypothetical protein
MYIAQTTGRKNGPNDSDGTECLYAEVWPMIVARAECNGVRNIKVEINRTAAEVVMPHFEIMYNM